MQFPVFQFLRSSKIFLTLALFGLCSFAGTNSTAQPPAWRYFGPDNTGVGSDFHSVITEDRTGTLFGAGYDAFYKRGSIFRWRAGTYTNWGNMEQYLRSERVNDIVFTTTNRMYAATDSGVVSYDGQTWRHYTKANSGLLYDQVISLALDPVSGHLWATTRQFGQPANTAVSVFNGATWTSYPAASIGMQPLTLLGNITVDAQGTKWIAYSRGLIRYNGTAWTILSKNNTPLSNWEVIRVHADRQNRLWCVAGNGSQTGTGIDILDLSANSWSYLAGYPVANPSPEYLHVRGNKVLIVEAGTFGRTFIRDGGNWTVLPNPNGDQAFGAFIDTLGRCWVPGKGFIKMYDGSWQRYTRQSSGLAEYDSRQVFVDSRNRKWFANGNGGIQIFDCPKWEVIGKLNEGLWPNTQTQTTIGTGITEDKGNGDIWITYTGTNGFAVRIPNGNTAGSAAWTTYTNSSAHGTNTGQVGFSFLEQACANGKGEIGFINSYSAGGNAYIFNRLTNSWATYKKQTDGGPLPGPAECIAADSAGAFYVGTFQKIARYQNGTWTVLDPTLQGGPATFSFVYDIHFDAANRMWVGTGDGIWRYDGAAWTHWTPANSALTGPQVRAITSYGGKVFAAAGDLSNYPYGGGLSVFDGNGWAGMMYGTTPLIHYQVNSMDADTLGNIWIATIEGVNAYRQGGTLGFECLDNDHSSWTTVIDSSLSVQGRTGGTVPLSDPTVYPNPVGGGQPTLRFRLSVASRVRVRLLDVQGRTVLPEQEAVLAAGDQQLSLDVRPLSAGLYYCEITAGSYKSTGKVVVQ